MPDTKVPSPAPGIGFSNLSILWGWCGRFYHATGPASAGPLSWGVVAGLRLRQAILGVAEFERDGVAAARSNLCLVGERRSRARRSIILPDSGPPEAAALTSSAGSVRQIGSSPPHRD